MWCPLNYNVTPQPGPEPTLKVMTYNIHEGVDVNNRLNLAAIVDTINQWDPDILVLQEADTGYIMNRSVDQVRWLAMKLNMYFVTVSSHDHIWQGDAILSKYPIIAWDSILLESPNEVNTCLNATIIIYGQQLIVFAVHLTVMSP